MSIAWIIVGALLLGILIYGCAKNELVKSIVLTVLCIGLPLSAGYCGLQLNTYYNAEGGIIGKLTGIYNPNKVNVVEELTYKVDNIELRQVADGSETYSAKIIIDDVFEYDTSKNYVVTVNDSPCFNMKQTDDGMIATYSYNFYNEKYSYLTNSDLTISISFYDTHTYMILQTNDGQTAVDYWNAYFNTHDFVIAFKESAYSKNDSFEYGNGEIPADLFVVDYCVNNEIFVSKLYNAGATVDLSITPSNIKFDVFQGWSLDGVNAISNLTVFENVTLKAVYARTYGLFDSEYNLLETWDECIASETIVVNGTTLNSADIEADEWLLVKEGITSIDEGAVSFARITNFDRLILPSTLIYFDLDVVEDYVKNSELTSFVIPEGIQTISGNIYSASEMLTVYIPASVKNIIPTSDAENALTTFCACGPQRVGMTIYCGATEKPSGWKDGWNNRARYNDDEYDVKHTVKWGYTYEQYLAEIGQ